MVKLSLITKMKLFHVNLRREHAIIYSFVYCAYLLLAIFLGIISLGYFLGIADFATPEDAYEMLSCSVWYITIIEIIIPIICGLKKWKKYLFPGTYKTITNEMVKEILETEEFKNKIPVFEKYLLLIPIIFAITVIPNLVRIVCYNPELASYPCFPADTLVMDMFMYYKNQAMMLLDAVLVVVLLYLGIKRKLSLSVSFFPLLVYFIMVVLSSIASVAPTQTWKGFYEMLESAFAVFGYCLICYYAYLVVKSEMQLKVLGVALAIGMLFGCGVGLSQFFGKDFFMTDIGKDFIFPEKYAKYKDLIKLAFGPGRVYMTLYNPNYVGAYASLFLPLLVILAFTAKKKLHSVLYCVLLTMVMICMVGANSKTALFLMILGMIPVFLYFRKHYWKKMSLILLLCIVEFCVLNNYQGEKSLVASAEKVLSSKSTSKSTSESTSESISKSTSESTSKSEQGLKEITLYDDRYEIIYNDEMIEVKYIKNDIDSLLLEVVDSKGNEITTSLNKKKKTYTLKDDRFDGLKFILGVDENENMGFTVRYKKKKFFIFYSDRDETYYYTNYYGRPTKMYSSDTYESYIFSLLKGFKGRGFIWGKSIPILKETIILGSGPDTYAFMFPQYDYVDLVLNGWEKKLIIKPHSMYLQIGIQTGVLSLVAFLIFNIIYIVKSIKLYYNKKLETFAECCGAGIFVGVIGFLGAMMTTDSTIGVSILYWSLLGIGCACNRMIKEGQVKEEVPVDTVS